jgi:hypothetical protein
MLIALRALHDLEIDGVVIPAGTTFDAPAVAAAVLRYQRKVDFAPPGVTAPSPSLPPEPVAPPRRRTRRKDDIAPTEADAEAAPPGRVRRTYRRRDLTAEP